jgi:hypothetical protein
MLGKFSRASRLIVAIGVTIVATMVVVPTAVRARHRLPHRDLGQHDPIPNRLRLNWNGETPGAKVRSAPPDERQHVSPLPAPTAFSAFLNRPERSRASDERISSPRLDQSPLVFRGPPATLLS